MQSGNNSNDKTLSIMAKSIDLKVRDESYVGNCGICSKQLLRRKRCGCASPEKEGKKRPRNHEIYKAALTLTSLRNCRDCVVTQFKEYASRSRRMLGLKYTPEVHAKLCALASERSEAFVRKAEKFKACPDELFRKYADKCKYVYILPDTPKVRADIARIAQMGKGGFQHQAERIVTSGMESGMLLWKGKLQQVLDNFAEMRNTLTLNPKVYRLIESLFLHALTLSQCTTMGGYLSTVAIFCHGLIPPDTSITNIFAESFQDNFVHQSEENFDLTQNVRMLYTCWKSAVKGPFFHMFSRGLSIAISLGVLSLERVKESAFSRCVDNRFLESLEKQQSSCVDLFDAIFGTVVTVLETGVACYQEGNLMPILWSNNESKAIDNQYITICNQWNYVARGAYEDWKIGPLTRISYQKDLEKALTTYREYYSRVNDPFLRKHIENKIIRLASIQSDFLGIINTAERPAPFMVSLWGASQTGKSTIISTLLKTCDKVRGKITKDYDLTATKSGKFMDGCTEATRCILDDDIANKRSEKDSSEISHVDRIIGIKNNAPFFYPKSAVEAKDKTHCLAEYYFTTGNTQDFRAAEYSNCPHSIQGRPDILAEFVLVPEVRREGGFALDKAKAARYEAEHGEHSHILFNVTEAVPHMSDLTALSTYRPVVWKRPEGSLELTNIGIATFKAYMSEKCVEHFAQQKALLASKKNYVETIEECPHEDCKYTLGSCPVHDTFCKPTTNVSTAERPASVLPCPGCSREMIIYPNVDEGNCPECRRSFVAVRTTNLETLEKCTQGVQHQAIFSQRTIIQAVPLEAVRMPNIIPSRVRSWYSEYTSFIENPEQTLEHDRASYIELIMFYNFIEPYTWDISNYLAPWLVPVIYARMHKYFVSFVYVSIFLSFMFLFINVYISCMLCIFATCQLLYIRAACKRMATIIINRSLNRIPEVMALAKKVAVGAGIFAGLYTLGVALRIGYRTSVSLRHQGEFTQEDKPDHDKALKRAQRETTYYQVRKYPLRRTELSRTTSDLEHLLQRIYRNTARASFKYLSSDGIMFSAEGQVLMISNHWMLIPTHYLEVTEGTTTVITKVDDTGSTFECRIDKLNSTVVIGDVSLAWVVENGSKFENLEDYLLKELPSYDKNTSFDMAYCAAYFNRDYEEERVNGVATLGNTEIHGKEYLSMYDPNRKTPTSEGMCGAPMVSTQQGFAIVGLHSAGQGYNAAFAMFSKKELEKAKEVLQSKLVMPLKCPDSGVISNGRFGITLLTESELHPKSALNFQTETAIQYHGSIIGRSTPKNVMVDTICRSLIEEKFAYLGLDPLMEPEINPYWKPWQSWYAKAGQPGHSLPWDHMVRAYVDWKKPLLDLIRDGPSEIMDLLKPLDDEELANGRLDNKLIRPLNFKSVVGGMLPGSKERYCTTYEKEGRLMRMFNDTIESQRKQDEENLQNLTRCNVIIKGLLKLNEANTKPKCRVMMGWSAADTMNIRRVCAGPAALLQMYPFISECMVGLDRHLDWHELREFLREDHDHLLGGDYSSWDAKMCSMLTYFAYSFFIEAGMALNYSEEYMKQLITLREEIVYPYIAMSGDLISLNSGTHASGNAITVHINCIANSLLVRCAYYGTGHTGPFRSKVKLVTYGDDFNGNTTLESFTNNSIREYCADYGTIVTSSDKNPVMKDWMDKIDFLKTSTSFNPDLATVDNPKGIYGAADIDSILKPLRMRAIDSELNDKEHCATVFSDAAYELVFHGRDRFDNMVPLLIETAQELGFYNKTTFLQQSYDVLVEKILKTLEARD